MTRARSLALVLAGVTVVSVLGVGLWQWRSLPGSPPPDPPRPDMLDEYDRAVVDLVEDACARVIATPRDGLPWYNLGVIYEANEEYPLAVECYAQAVALEPGSAAWWYRLAMVRSAIGDLPYAIDAMGRSVAIQHKFSASHWRLGLWHLDLADFAAAEHAFRTAIEVEPNDLNGTLGLAKLRLHQDDNAGVVALLEPLVANPRSAAPYAYQLLGTAYQRLGRAEDARLALGRGAAGEANWGDPTHGRIMQYSLGYGGKLLQARELASSGQVASAIATLERLRTQRPDNALVVNNLAAAYRAVGRLDDSLVLLTEVIERRPDFYPARYTMALVLQAIAAQAPPADAPGFLRQAVEHLRHAMKVNPTYAAAAGLRGDLLVQLDDLDAAIVAYEQAAQAEPNSARWPFRAAEAEVRLRRFDDAAARLEPMHRRWPQMDDVSLLLGFAWVGTGDVDRAAALAQDVGARRPDDTRVAQLRDRIAQATQATGPSPEIP